LWRTHAELEERHWWFTARREIIVQLATEVLPPSQEWLAVDIGCGTGGNTRALSQLYAAIGTDPASAAIDLARQRFPEIDYRCGDALEVLGDRWREVRLVLLADVLEHIEEDVAFFRGVAEACPAGAYFLITVPAEMRLWSRHDEVHHHFRRYDLARLQAVWRGLPVECLLLSPFNSRLYPLIRAARAGTGWMPWRRASDLALPPRWINRCLHRILAGEGRRLLDQLGGQPAAAAARRGVSLVAILRLKPH
jgi:SAM-dependent methyltransferase